MLEKRSYVYADEFVAILQSNKKVRERVHPRGKSLGTRLRFILTHFFHIPYIP
jgi:hypothetical protein